MKLTDARVQEGVALFDIVVFPRRRLGRVSHRSGEARGRLES